MNIERFNFIVHKNKSILFLDYSNIKFENELAVLARDGKDYTLSLGKKDLLILIDLTHTFVFGKALEELKSAATASKPFVRKDALIGLEGPKMVLLNFINKTTGLGIRAFANKTDAMDYLVNS